MKVLAIMKVTLYNKVSFVKLVNIILLLKHYTFTKTLKSKVAFVIIS